MITVQLHRQATGAPWQLTVVGHAQSGPWGQDIVCAAASALVETLALGVRRQWVAGSADVDNGQAHFQFVQPMSEAATAVVETFVAGFEDLATSHGEFVQFTETSKEPRHSS